MKVETVRVEQLELPEDDRAELKRVIARIVGRKLTGEFSVHLADGGVNACKVSEVVKIK